MQQKEMVRKRKARSQKKGKTFDTSKLAIDLFGLLASDFRREGFSISPRPLTWLSDGNLESFREWSFVEGSQLEPLHFKMARQMNNFLSKYTFPKDAVSPEQRENQTLTGWLVDAARIATCIEPDYPTLMVLREARLIVKEILGEVPEFDDIAFFAKVGTRATRSCKRADAGLDVYLTSPLAFSSSSECLKWVTDTLLPSDPLLRDLLSHVSADTASIESIVLTLVPKKVEQGSTYNATTAS